MLNAYEKNGNDQQGEKRTRGEDDVGTPQALQAAVLTESEKRNKLKANVVMTKAWKLEWDRARAKEAVRQLHKRQKRIEHEHLAAYLAKNVAAVTATSAREHGPDDERHSRLGDGVVTEADVAMHEPSGPFRKGLGWSAAAAQALQEVRG